MRTLPYARLLQYLFSERIPDARVFMDLDSIEAGLDLAEVIREAVGSCAVLVALIGRQWATLANEQRRPRGEQGQVDGFGECLGAGVAGVNAVAAVEGRG